MTKKAKTKDQTYIMTLKLLRYTNYQDTKNTMTLETPINLIYRDNKNTMKLEKNVTPKIPLDCHMSLVTSYL